MSIVRRYAAVGMAMALALAPTGIRSALAVPPTPPPGAVNDSYSVNEDQVLTVPAPGVLGNDTPLGGTLCVVNDQTTGLDGSLGAGVAPDGSFAFTPTANFNGPTTFTYGMADASGGCPTSPDSTATVTITVAAVNDKPVLTLGPTCSSGVTVDEDSGPFTDTARCLDIDWGGGESQNVASWSVSTNHPELFSTGPSISTYQTNKGRLAFTPAANANGSATVTVKVKDNGGTANGGVDTSDATTFTITINPVNDPPTASPDSFIVLKDRTLNVGVPGVLLNDHDIDSQTLTAVKFADPTHGVLVLAADGSFSYTPNAGFVGIDTFLYQAFDGSSKSAAQAVTLTVTAIPPVATPTPIPTDTPAPTPTVEPTVGEGLESFVPDATDTPSPSAAPSLAPGQTAQPTTAPSLEPGATPAPGAASDGGGISLPVLLVLVLLVLLVAFGAALYVPNWLREHGGGPPDRA